jgi:mono/diheme cytochrome c family protein
MRRSSLGCLTLLLLGVPATGVAAGDADKGKPIYNAQCVTCHGKTGDGNGPVGRALNPRPKSFTKADLPPDEKLASVIRKGGKANGLSKDMDAYPALSDAQLADVIAYIKTLAK